MARVLVIGDTHEPFSHPGYLQFCVDVWNKWNLDTVVHIGDVTDNHMCSKYSKHPGAMGLKDEVDEAYNSIQQWYETFPQASVCIGNHDARPARAAEAIFFPERFIKGYSEIWGTPGWRWSERHEIDGVQYVHGEGSTGRSAAIGLAIASMQSTTQGHTHSFPGVCWTASSSDSIFGLNVGCGLDVSSYASAYGKNFKNKPVLGCGVVLDGVEAYFIKMELGRKGRKSRGKKY